MAKFDVTVTVSVEAVEANVAWAIVYAIANGAFAEVVEVGEPEEVDSAA